MGFHSRPDDMTEAGVAEASKKEAGQPDHNDRGTGRHDVMARIELL
jgi:hypothetical protein